MPPSSEPATTPAPRWTWQDDAGSVRLAVEHRGGRDGGPTLRIAAPGPAESGSAAGETDVEGLGHEWLRFDCFERSPHYHLDPDGRDEVVALPRYADPVSWTVEELRRDWRGWLEKAGWTAAPQPDRLDAVLAAAESAMRNPPAQLDSLDLELLRSRHSEKWSTYGDDVFPAWVAEMDFPLAEPVRLSLQRAVDRYDVGYPVNPRRMGLLEAFRDRMAERFDWAIEPIRSEILTDVVQAMYLAVEAFSEPGDGVVVQTPIYPPFLGAVADTGRRLVESRVEPAGERFEFDPERLRAAVDERTRVMLLCNPHNPTGRVFTRSELESLANLALERDLVVVMDEIHADLVHPGHRHIPLATLGPEIAARTVTLTSATKAFNIPGLRCALGHFGDRELQRRFNEAVPRNVRGGMGILGLYATRDAWRYAQPWLDEVLAYLDGNRRFLTRQVADRLPGVRCIEPEATYLAWLDFSAFDWPKPPALHLGEHARVALSDGRRFGSGFEGFARLNFATSRTLLERVLDALAEALPRG